MIPLRRTFWVDRRGGEVALLSVELHYENDRRDDVISALMGLVGVLLPAGYSVDEGVLAADAITDLPRFRTFLNEEKSGFFLYSPKVTYAFTMQEKTFGVFSHHLSENHANEIFRSLVDVGPIFGYAADRAERLHRNRLTKSNGKGSIESWVGRDFSRWLPGVYWQTWLSRTYIAERGVPLESLENAAWLVNEFEQGWVFQFFQRATGWRGEAPRLDEMCRGTPGVFSVTEVIDSFAGADGLLATSEALREWQ